MRSVITITAVLCSLFVFGQRQIQKDVGDFNELKVFDLIEVNLIASDENRVIIKGENTDDVKVINEHGKLKIRMHLEKRFNGERTFVEVYYTSIDIIDANEGAYIVSNEAIEQNTIMLRSQEGGKIKVGLKTNHTKIKAVTGGIVEASGLSKSQEIILNTGGIFEGMALETQDTKVAITAAGEAEVNASDKVDVRVVAGGDVIIYGDPKEIKKNKFAGGRIKVLN